MGIAMHHWACGAPAVKFKFDGQHLIFECRHGPSHPPLSLCGPPPGPNGNWWVHGVGIWSEFDGHGAAPRYSRLQGQDRLPTSFVIQDILKGRKKRQNRLKRPGWRLGERADHEPKPRLRSLGSMLHQS